MKACRKLHIFAMRISSGMYCAYCRRSLIKADVFHAL
jgi:hypothetical protein